MTLQQGMRIGGFLMKAGGQMRGGMDAANARQDEADYDEYMNMIRSGKNPEEIMQQKEAQPAPDNGGGIVGALSSKPKSKINHKALIRAYTDDYKIKMHDQTFRMGQMKLAAAKTQQATLQASEAIKAADVEFAAGNDKGWKQHMAEFYTQVNNGEHVQYFPAEDKAYSMVDGPDGELVRGEEFEIPSWDVARQQAQTLMDTGDFQKLHMNNQYKFMAYNLDALNNMEKVVDKNGKEVGYMAKLVNRENGLPDWSVSFNGTTGRDMSWAEAKKNGYMLASDYVDKQQTALQTAKTVSEINKNRATAQADVRKGWSPERKLAHDLATDIKGFKGDTDAAMRYVQKIKNAKNVNAAYKLLEDMVMLTDEEKEMFIMSVMAKLPDLEKPGRDKGIPMAKGSDQNEDRRLADKHKSTSEQETAVAKGLPGKEQKDGRSNTPPVKGARKAPDGFWYVKRDGKFYRVKQ
jgi:hypothetical protein